MMAPEARQRRPWIAAVWLLLAAIFAHALLPAGEPMSRVSGSAFSAATDDVTLLPTRTATAAFIGSNDGSSSAGTDGSGEPGEYGATVAPGSAFSRIGFAALMAAATDLPAVLRPARIRPDAARAPPSS